MMILEKKVDSQSVVKDMQYRRKLTGPDWVQLRSRIQTFVSRLCHSEAAARLISL